MSNFVRTGGRTILSVGNAIGDNANRAYHYGISSVRDMYAYMRSAVAAAIPWAQRAREFLIENTVKCFFCGSVMHIAGSFLYAFPVAITGSSTLFTCAMVLIFVGGIVMWVPLICWWLSYRHQNRLDDDRRQAQLLDKPPVYESLPPAPPLPVDFTEPPPTYEEIYADNQSLLHDSSSDYGFPCEVHLPITTPAVDTVVVSPMSHPDRCHSPSM